jgi:nucleoid-associated protein YgaU
MTKPALYLILLTGGALAAGAGVVTYSEWQAAQQAAAPVAAVEAPQIDAAPAEAPPASPEESLATPLSPPPASAPTASEAPRQESEVAAVSPEAEVQAAEEAAPEVPSTAPRPSHAAPTERPRTAEPSAPAAEAEEATPPPPHVPEEIALAPAEAPEAPPQPAARQPSESAAIPPEEPRAAPAEPAAPPQLPETAVLAPEETVAVPEESTEAALSVPAFDIVRVEPTGEAVIAGSAPGGSKVEILSNGEVIAETQADEGGNWVALPELPLRPGSHDLTVRALGDEGEAAESEQRVAIAVPDEPDEEVVAVLDVPGQPSEVLAGPGREAPRAGSEPPQKLEPMATASEVAEAARAPISVDAVEAEGRTMYVAGAGDPGALVRVYVDGELVGEAQAGAGGRWLVEATRTLEEGEVTVRADQLKAGSVQVEARAEVPFMRRLDMAALVPAARAGAGAGESAQGAGLPQPGAVIIRRGDNLWTISRRTYGRGIRYTTIYRANEDQIRDPHWIYPGQVFMLPTGDRAWTGN